MKPFMRMDTAEYCSACHKVHLDVAVNQYRWFRGFNDYDNWQASGVSGQGARSFYYPAKSANCADCHMPLTPSSDPGNHDGKVHSHRFPGSNTAVPFVNRDQQQLDVTEQFLKSGFITVDIFAVSPIEEAKGATPMVRRLGEGPQAMSGIASGEEVEQSGQGIVREVGKIAAPVDKAEPRYARMRWYAWTWLSALAKLDTSSPAARRMRSMFGWNCRARMPTARSCSGAAAWKTAGEDPSSPARISTARTNWMAKATKSTSGTPDRPAACYTPG
jgi:hypothetical protein